jgi:hypothetical protein
LVLAVQAQQAQQAHKGQAEATQHLVHYSLQSAVVVAVVALLEQDLMVVQVVVQEPTAKKSVVAVVGQVQLLLQICMAHPMTAVQQQVVVQVADNQVSQATAVSTLAVVVQDYLDSAVVVQVDTAQELQAVQAVVQAILQVA